MARMDRESGEGLQPNPGIRALAEALEFVQVAAAGPGVVKVQPPDGMVARLPDGTLWSVTVHQLADESEWQGRP